MKNNFRFNSPVQSVPQPVVDKEPKPIKKYLIIGGILFVVLVIGLSIFLTVTREPDQNADNEEASMDYAGENSRLAGIQILIDYGLTYNQYKQIYTTVTQKLDKVDQESTYFDYISGSLNFEAKSNSSAGEISNAEREEILGALAENGDATTETFGPEGSLQEEASREEKEQLKLVSFKVASSLGKEYTIKFDSTIGINNMNIEVYDQEGNKL